MDQDNKISNEIVSKGLEIDSFFTEKNDFVLIFKKTEKLVSAVYMVTSLLSDNEPMKWTMRKRSGDLLSLILNNRDNFQNEYGKFIENLKTGVLEIVSFLEVLHTGGLISNMNFLILKQEFIKLIEMTNKRVSNDIHLNTNGSLSDKFFDVSHDVQSYTKLINSNSQNQNIVENHGGTNKMSFISLKDAGNIGAKDNQKKTTRQETILNLIRRKKELSIKDLSEIIKDCSEKTIQRELNSFIASGILKRAGVRRWSKYSLA